MVKIGLYLNPLIFETINYALYNFGFVTDSGPINTVLQYLSKMRHSEFTYLLL